MHQLATNNLLVVRLFEFMKLAQMIIVQIIGSVEDERTFSMLMVTKFKLWNQQPRHLNSDIPMFAQVFFTRDIFIFKLFHIGMMETRSKVGVNEWLFFSHSITCLKFDVIDVMILIKVGCYKHLVLQWVGSLWLAFKSHAGSFELVVTFKF